jgi:hypothetical protein
MTSGFPDSTRRCKNKQKQGTRQIQKEAFSLQRASTTIDFNLGLAEQENLETSPGKKILTLSNSLKAMGTPAMVVYDLVGIPFRKRWGTTT